VDPSPPRHRWHWLGDQRKVGNPASKIIAESAWGAKIMSYETEMVVSTVRAAQKLLGERLDPKTPINDRETLNRILDLLDDDRFNEAVKTLELEGDDVNTTWIPKSI
jgi:hypothetical protein